jgi:hypothetical protein
MPMLPLTLGLFVILYFRDWLVCVTLPISIIYHDLPLYEM